MQVHCKLHTSVHHIRFMSKILVYLLGCAVIVQTFCCLNWSCDVFSVPPGIEFVPTARNKISSMWCNLHLLLQMWTLLLHFKYAPFSVYKIQHCWLWVSLLSENVSIAFFRCTTPKRDVILESDSWIMNSMKLFWKLPMSNTVSNWMSQWERYGTIFHRSN